MDSKTKLRSLHIRQHAHSRARRLPDFGTKVFLAIKPQITTLESVVQAGKTLTAQDLPWPFFAILFLLEVKADHV